MKNRMSVAMTAELMGVSQDFIRMGLKNNVFPFGYAVKMSEKWTYYISPVKFQQYTGIQVL